MEKAKVKPNAANLYLMKRDQNNPKVTDGAQTLSGLRGKVYPVMGQYIHARAGPVIVLDTAEEGEVTLPLELVEHVA
jgi:hypothetical protein